MKVALLKIDEIPDEGAKKIEFFGRDVYVYKAGDKPVAAVGICMHFGGPLSCQDGKFVCAWHGAEYAMSDGHRLKAPAPANSNIMFLSTQVEDGVLNYVWGE